MTLIFKHFLTELVSQMTVNLIFIPAFLKTVSNFLSIHPKILGKISDNQQRESDKSHKEADSHS